MQIGHGGEYKEHHGGDVLCENDLWCANLLAPARLGMVHTSAIRSELEDLKLRLDVPALWAHLSSVSLQTHKKGEYAEDEEESPVSVP